MKLMNMLMDIYGKLRQIVDMWYLVDQANLYLLCSILCDMCLYISMGI